MSLEQNINNQIKDAMKAKAQDRLRALRAIKSAVLLAKTEPKKDSENGTELGEVKENKLLQKLAKQRKDSLAIYKEQGRDDLAAVEEQELLVIEEFLPKMMDGAEVKTELQKIIDATGANSMADMGKVMSMAMKTLAGKADGNMVSRLVKELLG